MKRHCCLALVLLLSGLLSSCTAVLESDLRPLLEQEQFPVTQGAAPEGSASVALICARDTGFYPFGFVPFFPMHLGDCVRALVAEARKVGGDGIAEVCVTYRPASIFDVANGIFPGWFAHVELTGSAYRLGGGSAR